MSDPKRTRTTLTLTLDRAEGALERVLGVVRRRGHPVASVAAIPDDEGWSVLLAVETDRPLAPLVKQLRNLVDVQSVGERPTTPTTTD